MMLQALQATLLVQKGCGNAFPPDYTAAANTNITVTGCYFRLLM